MQASNSIPVNIPSTLVSKCVNVLGRDVVEDKKYLEKMKQEDGTWSLKRDAIDLYNEITNSGNEEKQKVLPTLPQNNEEDE